MLGIKGPPVTATVAFSLAVVAALSLLISSLSSKLMVSNVPTNVNRIRLFKGESGSVQVVPGSLREESKGWMSVSGISVEPGSSIGAELRRSPEGGTEIVVTPRSAGRFDGLAASANLVDPLGLFEFHERVRIDLRVESLPTALKTRGEIPRVSPFYFAGENPAEIVGMGQELFAIADYQTGMDSKDIIWKRAARSPNAEGVDELQMRVREGGVKKVVKVGLTIPLTPARWRGEDVRRELTVDRVSEALGQLGKDLILIHSTLEVYYGSAGRTQSLAASNTEELGELVVGPWVASDGTVDFEDRFTGGVDVLVVASDDLDDASRGATRTTAPLLLGISTSGSPIGGRRPPGVFVFSGTEDLTGLAGEALTA